MAVSLCLCETTIELSFSKMNQLDLKTPDYRIYRLWDELADFGPEALQDALSHCMRSLCDMIGAQNSFWIGAVRMVDGPEAEADPLSGWRGRCINVLHTSITGSPERLKAAKKFDPTEPGETSRVAASGGGQFRVLSLGTGIVDLEAFSQTDHYDFFYRQTGIADRIWVVFPVSADTESYFLFDTHESGRFFSAQELGLVAHALRGLKWFHRQLLLSYGVGTASTSLTQAERRVIPLLLSGDGEKRIADKLELKQSTLHQYATSVYRKFGVRGRTEFMAIWLSGRM